MADTSKKVKVDFVIKSDEFNRNLTQTKQSIKQTTAELQTASAKLNTYGSNIQTLTGKQKLLETQITNVNGKMKLYQDNIEKNNQKLKVNQDTLQKLGDKKKDLSKQYKEAKKLYGEESEEALKLKSALDQCKSEYDETNNKIKSNNKAINSNTVEMTKSEAELVKLQGELKNTKQAIVENSNGFLKASEQFNKAGDRLQKLGGKISDVGGNLMKASAPFVALSGLAVKANIDFESAFTGVIKTVDATEEELALLRNGILEMSKVMPQSASAIAEVSESAGQLGIQTSNILDFTKTMVMLGDATNLTATEGASQLAKFANIVGMSQTEFSNLGSVIVALGNNLATTEADIVSMGMRLAGAGKQIGLTEAQIMAFSGALSSVGIEAEAGGSAFSKVMIEMQLAVETGNESLEAFASVAGMSAEQFQKAFKEDASEAIISFIKGLGNVESKGTSAIKVLDDMGIKEVRLRDSLLRASSASEVFTNALSIGNRAWSENTALSKEAETRYATTASKIAMLKNRFMELGIELGEELLPYVSDLMDGLEKLIDWFGGLDSETQKTILTTGLMTFATGGLLKVVGGLTTGIGGLSKGIGTTLGWLGKLTTTTSTVASATTGLASATGVATGGISALGGGLSVLSGIALPAIATIGALGLAFYGVHEWNDVMNSSMMKSQEEMSAMEIIMGKLSGQTILTKKEMESMGYAYEDWNSNVAPNTQKTLDDIAGKTRDLQFTIDSVNFDGVISEEDISSIKTKTDEWCSSIVEVIDNNKSEIHTSIKELFATDGIVNEEEQKVLDAINKGNTEKKKIVEDSAKQINEITARASKENREITEEEQRVIKDLTAKGNEALLESMNISNEEKLSAQDLFFQKANAHSAKSLSESLVAERTAMEERKQVIYDTYNSGIEVLQATIPNLTGLEKELAQQELDINIKKRDTLIQNENDKWIGIIGASEEQYGQYMDKINKYTGEEMGFWDGIANRRFNKEIAKYDEINRITEDGTYRVFNTESKMWDNLVIKTDEATGQIIAFDKLNISEKGIGRDKAIGYSQDIVNQMDNETQNAIKNRSIMTSIMNGYTNATVNSNGQIVDSQQNVIASLENVRETTDDTREGFIDINGTPIKVQINADGTIRNLKDIKTAVDNIPPSKDIYVTLWEKRRAVSASDGIDRFQAEGGTVNEGGQVTVNERGMELIDSISGQVSYLGRNAIGESINAPSNTKVTNALMTTLKMEQMVKREVSSGINNEISKMFETINSNLINSQKNNSNSTLSDEALNKIINSNLNVINALKEISSLLKENSNNMPDTILLESTLVAEGRNLAKVITPFLPKEQMKYEKNNLK